MLVRSLDILAADDFKMTGSGMIDEAIKTEQGSSNASVVNVVS